MKRLWDKFLGWFFDSRTTEEIVIQKAKNASKEKTLAQKAISLVKPKPTINFTVLSIASSQIGVVEWAKDSNPKVEEYLDWGSRLDNKESNLGDHTPWCAGFVGWCLEKSGLKSTNSLMARSYEKWGLSSAHDPLPGDVVTFYRGEKKSGFGHVGFFLGFDKRGSILVLGGNQGDSVNVTAYSTARLTDIRRSEAAGNYTTDDLRELFALKTKILKDLKIGTSTKVT